MACCSPINFLKYFNRIMLVKDLPHILLFNRNICISTHVNILRKICHQIEQVYTGAVCLTHFRPTPYLNICLDTHMFIIYIFYALACLVL